MKFQVVKRYDVNRTLSSSFLTHGLLGSVSKNDFFRSRMTRTMKMEIGADLDFNCQKCYSLGHALLAKPKCWIVNLTTLSQQKQDLTVIYRPSREFQRSQNNQKHILSFRNSACCQFVDLEEKFLGILHLVDPDPSTESKSSTRGFDTPTYHVSPVVLLAKSLRIDP